MATTKTIKDFFKNFNVRSLEKRRRVLSKQIANDEMKTFSEPIKIFITQVKAINMNSKTPMVDLEITMKEINCLKDAVDLSKKVVRSVERRLRPQVGDITCPLEDDPTDIFKQVLYGIVQRGKV